MTVRYGKFEMPTKVKVDRAEQRDTFVRFLAEPFERGFGHTVGNALRRIMLTALEAPAIISIKIEGVPHEYMAIEGIVEDMTHIILNFKRALLRYLPSMDDGKSRLSLVTKEVEVTDEMLQESGGQYSVRLKDVVADSHFEVVNPDLHLFTATRPMHRKVALKIAVGRGYVASERHKVAEKVVDEIIIDSCFSPVRLVNYHIENTRVGQDTDFDRLVLEVTTDGRITPEEALTFATQIGVSHFQIFDTLQFIPLVFEVEEVQEDGDRETLLAKLALKINEIELSVRSTNCLALANIETIGELVVMPESDMLRFRNFGKKSLYEIKEKLERMGLSLGMDLSRYSIDVSNVKEVIQEYLQEKAGIETS